MNNGHITVQQTEVPVSREVDVLVIGGGAAGIAAAISAAEGGASTMIVEQRGYLGGMGTVALVPAFCPYTDKVKPIIRGLGLKLMERMKQACDPGYQEEYREQLDWVPIDPEVLKRVYDNAILESGVTPLFHTFVYDVVRSPDGQTVEGVLIVNKSGRSFIRCRYIIDCTGDGDIAALSGVPFQKGAETGSFSRAACVICWRMWTVQASAASWRRREIQVNCTGRWSRPSWKERCRKAVNPSPGWPG